MIPGKKSTESREKMSEEKEEGRKKRRGERWEENMEREPI